MRRKNTLTNHFEAVVKLFGGLKRIVMCVCVCARVLCCVIENDNSIESIVTFYHVFAVELILLFICLAADIRVDLDAKQMCSFRKAKRQISSIKTNQHNVVKWCAMSERKTRKWSERDMKKNATKTAGLKSNYKCINFFHSVLAIVFFSFVVCMCAAMWEGSRAWAFYCRRGSFFFGALSLVLIRIRAGNFFTIWSKCDSLRLERVYECRPKKSRAV